jgi:hypothetical protein
MSRNATCRLCGEAIVWTKTFRNKNMPLDPEPSEEGKYTVDDFDSRDPQATRLSYGEASNYTGPKYACHFQTCSERKGDKDGHEKG